MKILICFCVLVAIIPIINGKKFNLRTKRSLFHQNGSEKDEYKTFKLASSVLDPQREKIFTNEPKKVRPSSKTQIDDWGPMFGGKKISYSKAIERVANERNERNKLHQNNKLHQKEKRSVKLPRKFIIDKQTGNRVEVAGNLTDNYFELFRNEFRSPLQQARDRYPELNHLPDSFVILKAFIDEQDALTKKRSSASSSGVNGVRNSGGNQTGGGTNTDSKKEGNDNRGSGVGLEGDRTGESMKGATDVTNSGHKTGRINSGSTRSGINSDDSGGGSNSCGSGDGSNSGGSISLWSQISSAFQSLINFLSFNEVRNSGENQTGGGTNTDSRNEGNDSRGSGVDLEGDRPGESIKGDTTDVINSGNKTDVINSGNKTGGVNSDDISDTDYIDSITTVDKTSGINFGGRKGVISSGGRGGGSSSGGRGGGSSSGSRGGGSSSSGRGGGFSSGGSGSTRG